jgi:RimJ/RimL family protein N-acetyltransferase
MPQAVLRTERLRLRPRAMADLEACVAMDLDPEVRRFIFGDRQPDSTEHRARVRAQIASGWPAAGGIWVVEWRQRRGLLGWCGLFPLENAGPIEIGYRYVQSAWGQGIATEAARALLDHGFRALRFDPIVGVTHPANRASQRVLEKIGLQPRGAAFHYGQVVSFFELRRDAYLAGAGRALEDPIPSIEGDRR